MYLFPGPHDLLMIQRAKQGELLKKNLVLACGSFTPTPKKENMAFLKEHLNMRDYVD